MLIIYCLLLHYLTNLQVLCHRLVYHRLYLSPHELITAYRLLSTLHSLLHAEWCNSVRLFHN